MQIEYRTGDLLAGPERVIVHGCNAQGVMRSGIAAQIRDVFPQAYTAYRQEYDRAGRLDLGATIWANCGEKFVINAITQEYYGRDSGRRYVSYEALRKAIRAINAHAHFSKTVEALARSTGGPLEVVGMPLIGAGLANGSWRVIAGIIEEEATNFQPVVYLYDGVMPTT